MKKICLILLLIYSCSKDDSFSKLDFDNSFDNAQPYMSSDNSSTSISWISSNKDKATLNFSHYIDNQWTDPMVLSSGNNWFVNWADFPAHAINDNLILSSYLKKSDSGTYNYDIYLNLIDLKGNIVKENFLLHNDGLKAEHGFVSIVSNENSGFYVSWLDGRNTVEKHFDGSHKPMTIRFAEVTKDGEIIKEHEIDSETCDCCQTSIISSKEGPIIVYRDRSKDEVRDIYIARNINGVWTQPKPVFNDGWVINGCPVNGPKADVNLSNIAVAWFTVVDGKPYTRLAFSNNYGETFDNPINLNDNDSIGRVDVAFLDDKQVIVSYMEFDGDYAFLKVKKVSVDGKVSKPFIVSKIDAGRNTGVPQLEIINNDVFLAWTTSVNGRNSLKTKKINSNSI
jgi:hypothetical protein